LGYFFQIAAQETCPADLDAKCGDGAADDWEGEFFPGISKIKYEVRPWKFRALNICIMLITGSSVFNIYP
jgi:hypothetical protein